MSHLTEMPLRQTILVRIRATPNMQTQRVSAQQNIWGKHESSFCKFFKNCEL